MVKQLSLSYSGLNKLKLVASGQILVTILFLFTLTVAIVLYPNYNFITQTLSKLGVWKKSFCSALVFNCSLIIVSIFTLVWLNYGFIELIKTLDLNSRSITLGNLANLSLIGVAIFPTSGSVSTIHFIFAFCYFLLMSVAILDFSLQIFNLQTFKRAYSYSGFVITLLSLLFLVLFFTPFGPLMQKITVLSLMSWNVLISVRIFSKIDFSEQMNAEE